jgi:dTDP-4-dehydrorhamnose reductase
MHVAVIGAHGQLGAAIVHEFSGPHAVTSLARGDLDLTDDRAVAAVMSRLRPDLIVNCAAYNEVDGAEDHPVEALNVNALAVRALARAAAEHAAPLVHYSTDFVFDGTASAPYVEDDRPNPRSMYAASKLLGEWFAADVSPWYVLRVESLFGRAPGARPGKKTVAAIVDKLVKGEDVKVFQDRTVSPTYVIDAADATRRLVESGAASGVYHCVNSGYCTWLEMASELASLLGVEPRLVPMRMTDVTFRAARPLYCALSNGKLRAAGIEMPAWQDAVRRFLAAEGHGVRS